MEANIAAEIDSQLGEQLVGSDLQRRLISIGDDRIRYYRNPLYSDRTVEFVVRIRTNG